MNNGSFTVKTNKPGVEVSWQVTGVRQDAWANAHRIQVEVEKAPQDQGHYLHPELFGHQGEPNIAEMHHSTAACSGARAIGRKVMNGKTLLLFAASLVAYGQTPVVRSAIVNSTTNQITIAGSSLLPTSGSPVVYLDGELLTLVSSSSTQIVATMPALPAGSFRLVVGSGVFDVTNGAVGPAGPAGATGATGPAGPAGPQGPSGSLTLPFSGTASDTTTCVFCITNTAPQHAAIAGQGGQALSGANSGGTGVGAYGGTSNGTSILVGKGGSGVYAVGGAAAAVSDEGGLGLNAYGGNSKSTGGSGVQATGGQQRILGRW
jgi:IPT/TIG domain